MPGPNWINPVTDGYTSIQAAISALPVGIGGVIYLQEGTWSPTTTPSFNPPLVLPTDRRVHLLGAGSDRTILSSTSASTDMILLKGDHSTIEGLTLQGPNATGSGRGVVIGRLAADDTGVALSRANLRDVIIRQTPSWGIYVLGIVDTGANGNTTSILCSYEQIEVSSCKSSGGISIHKGCTSQRFRDSSVVACAGYQLYMNFVAGSSFENCAFERGDDTQPYAWVEGCQNVAFQTCWFEHLLAANTKRFIQCQGANQAVLIANCRFVRTNPAADNPNAIYAGTIARNVVVINPEFYVGGTLSTTTGGHIFLDTDAEAVVIGGRVETASGAFGAVRITDNTSTSTLVNAGFRLRMPRLTNTDVANLADWKAGDLIFNSTVGKARVFDGSVWRDLW